MTKSLQTTATKLLNLTPHCRGLSNKWHVLRSMPLEDEHELAKDHASASTRARSSPQQPQTQIVKNDTARGRHKSLPKEASRSRSDQATASTRGQSGQSTGHKQKKITNASSWPWQRQSSPQSHWRSKYRQVVDWNWYQYYVEALTTPTDVLEQRVAWAEQMKQFWEDMILTQRVLGVQAALCSPPGLDQARDQPMFILVSPYIR